MKKIPLLIILVGTIAIIACSPKVLYPRLDWLIPWYIDDYISLDRSQSSQVSSRLNRQLDWHCHTQLPQYAEFLMSIRREVLAGQSLTIARLETYNDRLSQHWYALLERIGPDIIDILFSATDEQIAELFENLERKNRKKEIEYVELSPQDVIHNRQQRMQKQLKFWFSDLTDFQKQAVGEWSLQLEPMAAEWIAHRRTVQGAAQRLLVQGNHSADIRNQLMELIMSSRELRDSEYQRKIDFNTERTLVWLAELSQSLTPDQIAHFSGRIQSLVTEIDQMNCSPSLKTDRLRMTSPG